MNVSNNGCVPPDTSFRQNNTDGSTLQFTNYENPQNPPVIFIKDEPQEFESESIEGEPHEVEFESITDQPREVKLEIIKDEPQEIEFECIKQNIDEVPCYLIGNGNCSTVEEDPLAIKIKEEDDIENSKAKKSNCFPGNDERMDLDDDSLPNIHPKEEIIEEECDGERHNTFVDGSPVNEDFDNERSSEGNPNDRVFNNEEPVSNLGINLSKFNDKKAHFCKECNKRFFDKKSLKSHFEDRSKKHYSCGICDKVFYNEQCFTYHSIRKCRSYYSCDVCKKCFSCKDNLNAHLKVHSFEKPYSCDKCSENFSSVNLLNEHLLVCRRCNFSEIDLKPNLESCGKEVHVNVFNMTLSSDLVRYSCCLCGYLFIVKQCDFFINLKDHFTNKHPFFELSSTDFVENDLMMYVASHTGEQCFSCEICGDLFSKQNFLNDHFESHSNYSCKQCGKLFCVEADLKIHLESHANEDVEFSCSMCGKLFILKQRDLVSQLQAHFNNKDVYYKCSKAYCPKKGLLTYVVSHKNGQRFPCDVCGDLFSKQNLLKDHLQVHLSCAIKKQSEKSLSSKTDVNPQLENKDNEEVKSSCCLCGQLFISKRRYLLSHLKGHFINKHSSFKFSGKSCDENNFMMYVASDNIKKCFSCKLCNDLFIEQSFLDEHLKVHSNNVCKHCKKSFSVESDLKNHMESHVDKVTYSCYLCGKVFIVKQCDLVAHLKAHFINKHDFAKFSDADFQENELMRLVTSHSDNQFSPCKFCSDLFSKQCFLNEHLKTHLNYHCKLCKMSFYFKIDLKTHLKTHAAKKVRYSCSLCGKLFSVMQCHLMTNLKNHFINKHASFKPSGTDGSDNDLMTYLVSHTDGQCFSCDICGDLFSKQTFLDDHVKVHLNYRCRQCELTFFSQKDLNKHLEIHANEEVKYSCCICGKIIIAKFGDLVAQLETHFINNGISNHCTKSYCPKNGLLSYVIAHRSGQCFPCQFCGDLFSKQSFLNSHLKVHLNQAKYYC